MSLSAKTREKVSISAADIRMIAGQNEDLDAAGVKEIIANVLTETLEKTLAELEIWIMAKVPKRTGQLRDNLLKNIRSSRVRGNILRLIIGTAIDYAERVNAMSTASVRHKGSWYEHSGARAYAYYWGHYGPIFLEDPQAVGGFFDELLIYAKTRIVVNLAKAKANQIKLTSIKKKELVKVTVK